MKNLKSILLICLFIITNISAQAQISKAEIIATGLTCSMCSNAINKQLKKIPEVESVTTDLNTNTFVVYFKKGNNVSPKTIKESVEKAGFFVGSLTVTIKSEELKSNPNYILVNAVILKNTDQAIVKVLDKGYVTEKEYKKSLNAYAKDATFSIEKEDDFHVKLIN